MNWTIADIEQMYERYAEEYMVGDAADFMSYLRRCAEMDDLLVAPEDIDNAEPVDLFGRAGVAGVAAPSEMRDLRVVDWEW